MSSQQSGKVGFFCFLATVALDSQLSLDWVSRVSSRDKPRLWETLCSISGKKAEPQRQALNKSAPSQELGLIPQPLTHHYLENPGKVCPEVSTAMYCSPILGFYFSFIPSLVMYDIYDFSSAAKKCLRVKVIS